MFSIITEDYQERNYFNVFSNRLSICQVHSSAAPSFVNPLDVTYVVLNCSITVITAHFWFMKNTKM